MVLILSYFLFLLIRISPDIKDAALCTGVKVSNNEDTWKVVLNVYMTTKSVSEKNSAQAALACSQNTSILYKYAIMRTTFLFDNAKENIFAGRIKTIIFKYVQHYFTCRYLKTVF